MSDIVEEIRQELRRESLFNLAKKYGVYFVAVIVGVLVVTTGYVIFEDINQREKEVAGYKFFTAVDYLQGEENPDAAKTLLEELTKSGNNGYKQLSGLLLAKQFVDEGKIEAAIAEYKKISANKSFDKSLRDLAKLYALHLHISSGSAKEDEVSKYFNYLTNKDSVWKHFALEMKAYKYINQDQPEEARKIFNELKADLSAPASLRKRAEKMSNMQSYVK